MRFKYKNVASGFHEKSKILKYVFVYTHFKCFLSVTVEKILISMKPIGAKLIRYLNVELTLFD